MATKNIKVSEVVYDSLESKKAGSETFDDVLRRILDLNPEIEDLAAYLPSDIREEAKDIAVFIESLAEFKQEIERDDIFDELNFRSEESDLTIAQLRFSEEQLHIMYRDKNGDLIRLDNLFEDHGKNLDDLKDRIEQKVNGAIRKWG